MLNRAKNPGVAQAGRRLRLIVGGAEPEPMPFPLPPVPEPEPEPEPEHPAAVESADPALERLPIGVSALPAAAWRAIVQARAQAGMVAELAGLREKVAALEHENRRLAAAIEAARAEGERVERERTVRTMGNRLPSILTVGRRRG